MHDITGYSRFRYKYFFLLHEVYLYYNRISVTLSCIRQIDLIVKKFLLSNILLKQYNIFATLLYLFHK